MRPYASLALSALFALSLALPLHADAPASDGWERVDEDDGITLWRREIPGQAVPGFRGDVTIDASLETIVTAIEDTSKHTEWMHRCAESRIVKQLGDGDVLLYNRTDSPWPVSDRDVLLRSKRAPTADGKGVMMTFQNASDPSTPPVKGVVRMPKLVGFYKLITVAPGKTAITYQVEAHVGGSLPTWMVKRVVKDMPYETLSRLRDRVTTKKK